MKTYRTSDFSLNPTEKLVIIISLIILLFLVSYKFFADIPKQDGNVITYTVNSVSFESKEVAPKQVNINTADEDMLCTLNGIGKTKAKAIIEYRNEHGNFSSVDELLNVNGIGEKTLENIKPYIIVE